MQMCKFANDCFGAFLHICRLCYLLISIWSFSLMDRISDSDSEGTGSIPVGTTKADKLLSQ